MASSSSSVNNNTNSNKRAYYFMEQSLDKLMAQAESTEKDLLQTAEATDADESLLHELWKKPRTNQTLTERIILSDKVKLGYQKISSLFEVLELIEEQTQLIKKQKQDPWIWSFMVRMYVFWFIFKCLYFRFFLFDVIFSKTCFSCYLSRTNMNWCFVLIVNATIISYRSLFL